MPLRSYLDKLLKIGLTDKQSRTYLSLLQHGASTADQISRASGLNRSTTYVQIKELLSYGLVSTFKQGKKTLFVAESPNNLERFLEQKREQWELRQHQASTFIPDLLKIYAEKGTRPAVRMFEGKEGLTSMREDILSRRPKELRVVSFYDNMLKVFSKEELREFTLKREKLKMRSFVLYARDKGGDVTPRQFQTMKRISLDKMPIGSDMYLYNNNVSFASTGDVVIGLTIENAQVARTMRGLFDVAWESLA